MAYILGIDTSNYTTSAALFSIESGHLISQEKLPLPVSSGEKGLRQRDAVFHHTRQLPALLERLRPLMQRDSLAALGVSQRPRDQEGSYMPCFLAGDGAARGIAAVTGVPLYELSHQTGHILAALYGAKQLSLLQKEEPFYAFHVSGGTTDLLFVRPKPGREDVLNINLVGTSLDLKAGQVIDRVGLMLGLSFPCGAALENLAMGAKGQDYLKPALKDGDCCLSGLENRCRKLLSEGSPPPEVAGYCLRSVAFSLAAMVAHAQRQTPGAVLYAGGVMSNRLICPILTKTCAQSYFCAPEYAGDNAVGAAIYALLRLEEKGENGQSGGLS